MFLTEENYYSKEADKEYISVSQYKLFNECEVKALATITGQEDATFKEAFLEGQLFEELVAGDAELFISKHHNELIAKTGKTAGEFKANFKKVLVAAEKFNNQEFLTNIVKNSQKQVILTGKINNIPVKGKLDLLDLNNKLLPDIKCMSDFNDTWSKSEKRYLPWYYNYGYVLQLAVYQELVMQNFGIKCETALLAATKEQEPDVEALKFDDSLLEIELEEFKNKIKRYDDIKKGLIVPNSCGTCEYCKRQKKIINFKEIK